MAARRRSRRASSSASPASSTTASSPRSKGSPTRPAGLSRTARQALGYRELLDHVGGRTSLDEAVHLAITRTRQFAVRQERWFRRDPRIRWVDATDDPIAALDLIEQELASCA